METEKPFVPSTIQPNQIEAESFKIIDSEIGPHSFDDLQYPIVRRIIHATADFDLGKSLIFHKDAIKSGIKGILDGKNIIADVSMVQSGISKPRLVPYGNKVLTYISDHRVMSAAKEANITRSIIATRVAVDENPEGIFVIGNAPTALLELVDLVKKGLAKPSLIIGMPVGFVSAAESKEELSKIDIPYITNSGRKGGTPAVVAAFNALAILAVDHHS